MVGADGIGARAGGLRGTIWLAEDIFCWTSADTEKKSWGEAVIASKEKREFLPCLT